MAGHLVIRYNRTAGWEFLVGAIAGILLGVVVYLVHPKDDLCIACGLIATCAVSAVIDMFVRCFNAARESLDALLGPSGGGHVWYAPVWLVGAVIALAFTYVI